MCREYWRPLLRKLRSKCRRRVGSQRSCGRRPDRSHDGIRRKSSCWPWSAPSPALRLQIVNVNVLAFGSGRDHSPDVLAILDRGGAFFQVYERNLVADGHIISCNDLEIAVVFGHDASKLVTGSNP